MIGISFAIQASEIFGCARRSVTFCLVEEVESGDWGIGGKAMTTADVHALARGKAA